MNTVFPRVESICLKMCFQRCPEQSGSASFIDEYKPLKWSRADAILKTFFVMIVKLLSPSSLNDVALM